MEHICLLTNLIVNSQLLKPFIEPILTNVLIWMIRSDFLGILNGLPTPRIFQFGNYFNMDKKFTQ